MQPASPIEENALFGAVLDSSCDEPAATLVNESAGAAAVLTKFALSTLVGLGSSLLDKAAESSNVVRSASAPGYFHGWNPKTKQWAAQSTCLRFWYGVQRSKAFDATDIARYGGGPVGSESEWAAIASRWAALGLVEQPYLYGEVQLMAAQGYNLMRMQPVVLYARTQPEAGRWFHKATKLAVAVDLKALGADAALGTQLLTFPDVGGAPVLIRGGAATMGLSSGWVALPAQPTEAADKDAKNYNGTPFSALVAFTSASDGSEFGKALASAFKAQKDDIVAAVTPQSKSQKAEAQQKANEAVFDAIAAVLDAQSAVDKATDKEKPRLEVDLKKAQYLANLKLQAAGLPARYPVNGP